MKCLLYVVVALLGLTGSVFATPVIDVGHHNLLPNTSGQVIAIPVHGGDQVESAELNVQVADGGPEAGGTQAGPRITHLELVDGTIFQTNGQTPTIVYNRPQLATAEEFTNSGRVSAEGTLAYVTFDTTGFFEGTWDLRLANTLNGDTSFDSFFPADTTNGTITVPEPVSLGLLGLGGLLLIRRRRG